MTKGLGNRRAPAEERPVVDFALFTALAFLMTWGSGMLLVLSTHANMISGVPIPPRAIPIPWPIAIVLQIIGAFGPFLAAIVITAFRSGRSGVRALLRQFGRWRVPPMWYAIALLGPALLGLIALSIDALTGRATPARWFLVPRAARFAGWTVGPWGEELGWRGYAQPTLQQRFGAAGAAVFVGTVWSLWHYWPVFTPAASLKQLIAAPIGIWLLYEIANSVVMAWLYNSTGSSLPIAWAAHVGLSLGQNLVNSHPIPFGSFVIVFDLAAIAVVLAYGPKRLS